MTPDALPWPAELQPAAGGGVEIPGTFGDREAEIAAVLAGSAATILAHWSVISVAGSDRVSFLNRLLTADIASLEEAQATPCLLLDNKGRVQACFFAVPGPDAVLLFGERAPLENAREILSRYVLAADVTLQRTEQTVIALGSAAAPAGATFPESSEGTPARTASDVYFLAVDGISAWRSLASAGIHAVGSDAAELWRVLRLWPAFDAEIEGREFPQELGLEAAIDFNKGCYLGQETVARIHYRGGVNRLLCRLRSSSVVPAGEELFEGDRRVGAVTSAAYAGANDACALAFIATDSAEIAVELRTSTGIVLRVDRVAGATGT